MAAVFKRQIKTGLKSDPSENALFKLWWTQFIDKLMSRANNLDIQGEDYITWLKSKTEWTAAKKRKYLVTWQMQASRSEWKQTDWDFAFTGFVKSGEVYFKENATFCPKTGQLLGQDNRPRLIFNPSDELCGPITWIQQFLFADIKRVLPGFIQGLGASQFKELVKKMIQKISDCMNISSDGSNYDGHQSADNLDIDTYLWGKSHDRIVNILKQYPDQFPYPEVMARGINFLATTKDTKLFLQFSGKQSLGINSISQVVPNWDKVDASKEVKRYFNVQGGDWIKLHLIGTTFSGHPTRTTLGNTIRSIIYHTYILKCAGVPEDEYFVAASGDDVCVWIRRKWMKAYIRELVRLTARNTDEATIGLGQCIKEWKESEWWDIDFCSKFCTLDNGEWIVSRDVSKQWREKTFYCGSNQFFHRHPEFHVSAMAMGSISEVGCQYLHEFYDCRLAWLQERATNYLRIDLIKSIRDELTKAFIKSTHLQIPNLSRATPEDHLVVHCGITSKCTFTLEQAHKPNCREVLLSKIKGKTGQKKIEKIRGETTEMLKALEQVWARQSKRFAWAEAEDLTSKCIPVELSRFFLYKANLDFGSLLSYARDGYWMKLAR